MPRRQEPAAHHSPDSLVSTERELFLQREKNSLLQKLVTQQDEALQALMARLSKTNDIIDDDLSARYKKARRTLEFEQEQYKQAHQRDQYVKMRGEFHDAIKDVRLMAVEIADKVTGYEP